MCRRVYLALLYRPAPPGDILPSYRGPICYEEVSEDDECQQGERGPAQDFEPYREQGVHSQKHDDRDQEQYWARRDRRAALPEQRIERILPLGHWGGTG